MAGSENRILLILDLDETLIHSVDNALGSEADFSVGELLVYQRPHLREFLKGCSEVFDIAIWSSGGSEYVSAIVNVIFPVTQPVFVWSRSRCTEKFDPETNCVFFKKDLKKVTRRGYSLKKILVVEDQKRNLQGQYGNAVYVSPFLGDMNDAELKDLLPFLQRLATAEDVRAIEKRSWIWTR